MQIDLGYDFNNNKFITAKEKKINNVEQQILEYIISYLKNEFNEVYFKIEAKSDDYLTLTYKEKDVIRLKYTDKSKWISIFMLPKYKKEYENNLLFETQKNKNQLFWKSKITDKNIDKYLSFIKIACKEIEQE